MVREQYQKHFFSSLFLHSIVLIVLTLSFEFSSPPPVLQNSNKPDDIIHTTLIDSLNTSKIVQKPIPQPTPKPKPVAPPIPKPTPPVIQDTATTALAIPDKQEKKLKEEAIHKQLLADMKQAAEQKKKQKQKALQAAFEKEIKELKANALEKQMLQEQKRLANARSQQMQGVVDKYKALILQSISQHWLVPPNANKKLFAELLIRVAPGGTVLDVQLIKSSGDEGLDRSARTAVFKASPLPVPTDFNEFEAFRQFVLKVKPENVYS